MATVKPIASRLAIISTAETFKISTSALRYESLLVAVWGRRQHDILWIVSCREHWPAGYRENSRLLFIPLYLPLFVSYIWLHWWGHFISAKLCIPCGKTKNETALCTHALAESNDPETVSRNNFTHNLIYFHSIGFLTGCASEILFQPLRRTQGQQHKENARVENVNPELSNRTISSLSIADVIVWLSYIKKEVWSFHFTELHDLSVKINIFFLLATLHKKCWALYSSVMHVSTNQWDNYARWGTLTLTLSCSPLVFLLPIKPLTGCVERSADQPIIWSWPARCMVEALKSIAP